LTTDRPYRARLSRDEALDELEREVQRGWRDEHLVSEFIDICRSVAWPMTDI
jgi:response regulator RpfG family c-di-GMP phosphodiesterase